MASRYVVNTPARSPGHARSVLSADDYAHVSRFFAAHPELTPTPLRPLDRLAAHLGVASVAVKDETGRFGLSAFKIVGAAAAVDRLMAGGAAPSVLTCATAGNHGRAVARVARQRGLRAVVYVPNVARRERVDAIAGEGAAVVVFDGTYDDAVREMARRAAEEGWQIVSDTGWDGYDDMPRWIMAGYTRMFDEAAGQWPAIGWPGPPDIVIAQAGVGGLAGAAACWSLDRFGERRPFMVAAEPTGAACLLESARAGRRVTLPGPLETMMEGLRSAEVSTTAWPAIRSAVDAFVAIDDEAALRAIADLRHAEPPIAAGPSGACGVAALCAMAQDPDLAEVKAAARLGPGSRVLAIVTEGP